MKKIKAVTCSALFGFLSFVGIELLNVERASGPGIIDGVIIFSAGLAGLYVARYISWGGLVGGLTGFFAGFYGLLLLLALLWPGRTYERGLEFMLFGAVAGFLIGGYALSRYLNARAAR